MEIIAMLSQRERPRARAPEPQTHLDALQADVDPARQTEAIRRARARRANASGLTAWTLADDAVAQARRGLLSPAPLPSLSGALARRAEIFGPQQHDEDDLLEPAPIPARHGLWRTLGQAARDAVASLAERRCAP